MKANADKVRVFTLGIGDGASHDLVEGIAKAGNGTSAFVTYQERMEEKIVNQLKNALQPSLYDISIEWEGLATDEEQRAVDIVVNTNKTLMGYNKPIESARKDSKSRRSVIKQSPKIIPPVFDGSQLLVLGIFENGCPKSALITAQSPDGPLTVRVEVCGRKRIPFEYSIKIKINFLIKHSAYNNLNGNGNLLHRLAAIKLIRELELEISATQSSEAEEMLKKEIIEIGCQNGTHLSKANFVVHLHRYDNIILFICRNYVSIHFLLCY